MSSWTQAIMTHGIMLILFLSLFPSLSLPFVQKVKLLLTWGEHHKQIKRDKQTKTHCWDDSERQRKASGTLLAEVWHEEEVTYISLLSVTFCSVRWICLHHGNVAGQCGTQEQRLWEWGVWVRTLASLLTSGVIPTKWLDFPGLVVALCERGRVITQIP